MGEENIILAATYVVGHPENTVKYRRLCNIINFLNQNDVLVKEGKSGKSSLVDVVAEEEEFVMDFSHTMKITPKSENLRKYGLTILTGTNNNNFTVEYVHLLKKGDGIEFRLSSTDNRFTPFDIPSRLYFKIMYLPKRERAEKKAGKNE